MKKQMITLLLGSVIAGNVAFASNVQPTNFITYPIVVKSWVTTKTAKVIIAMNANVSEKSLATLHQRVMAKLEKIANAQWHITQFQRSQDSSGLERVVIQAVARLQPNQLATLKSNVEKVSAPGEKYRIEGIQFKPTTQEVEAIRMQLRTDVYEKSKAELASINKTFPKADYQVYSINFMPMQMTPRPTNTTMFVKMAGDAGVSVGNQVAVSAIVKLQPKRAK